MKTLTQFSSFQLKPLIADLDALKKQCAADSKSPEETEAAIATLLKETHKVAEDRIKITLQAVEISKDRGDRVKRVVVFTAAEGETPSDKFEKRDEHYYQLEFFPQPPRAENQRGRGGRGGRDGRDDRNGKNKKRGRRGDGRPARGPRTNDGDSTLQTQAGGTPQEATQEGRESRPPRRPRRPQNSNRNFDRNQAQTAAPTEPAPKPVPSAQPAFVVKPREVPLPPQAQPEKNHEPKPQNKQAADVTPETHIT